MRRSGDEARADRPSIETFGENVGVLTREVFGLEVTQSGFYKMLEDAVEQVGGNYEAIMERFEDKLGSEARALVRGLIASQSAGQPDTDTDA
jgi:hypothetical protein